MQIANLTSVLRHGKSIEESTGEAAALLRRRVADCPREVGERASLALLELDGAEYEWLRAWAGRVTPRFARRSLADLRRQVDFGLLFLTAASERNRRHGEEGEAYPSARSLPWADETRELLFAGGGRQSLREVIRMTAAVLKLRSGFDVEAPRPWYETIILQAGPSRSGLASRLHDWLDQPACRPQVVDRLLGGADGRGPLRSALFGSLWSELEASRRSFDRERAAAAVRFSPWLPDEWADEVAEAAVRRGARSQRLAGDRADAAADAREEAGRLGDVAQDGRDELAARLSWPGRGAAEFRVPVPAPAEAEAFPETADRAAAGTLVAETYVAGRRAAVWRRQPNGSLRPDRAEYAVAAAAAPAEVVFEAVATDHGGLGERSARLYDADADVAAFESDGSPVDDVDAAWPASRREVWLLHADDLEAYAGDRPAEGETAAGPPGFVLRRLGRSAAEDFRLCLEGQTLWRASLRGGRPASAAAGEGVSAPRIAPAGAGRTELLVRPTEGASAVRLWLGGREVPLEPYASGLWRATVRWPDYERPWSVRYRLRHVGAEAAGVGRGTLSLEPTGLFVRSRGTGLAKELDEARWRPVPLGDDVRCDSVAGPPLRLCHPRDHETKDPLLLLAGGLVVGTCPGAGGQARVGDVPSRGEALLRDVRRFNGLEAEPPAPLSGPLVDRGVVASALLAGAIELWLTRRFEPSAGHRVHVLYEGGVLTLPAAVLACEENRWSVPEREMGGAPVGGEPAAVAVSYRGLWQGGFWPADWHRRLSLRDFDPDRGDASRLAAALRWHWWPWPPVQGSS